MVFTAYYKGYTIQLRHYNHCLYWFKIYDSTGKLVYKERNAYSIDDIYKLVKSLILFNVGI